MSLIGQFSLFGAFEHLVFTAATLLAFVILLSIFFDAMGVTVGLAHQAGNVNPDGSILNLDRVLLVAPAPSPPTMVFFGMGVINGWME